MLQVVRHSITLAKPLARSRCLCLFAATSDSCAATTSDVALVNFKLDLRDPAVLCHQNHSFQYSISTPIGFWTNIHRVETISQRNEIEWKIRKLTKVSTWLLCSNRCLQRPWSKEFFSSLSTWTRTRSQKRTYQVLHKEIWFAKLLVQMLVQSSSKIAITGFQDKGSGFCIGAFAVSLPCNCAIYPGTHIFQLLVNETTILLLPQNDRISWFSCLRSIVQFQLLKGDIRYAYIKFLWLINMGTIAHRCTTIHVK